MKCLAVMVALVAGIAHGGVLACAFVFSTQVEFSHGSSALQADQVRRLADYFIRMRQTFSDDGALVLTATAVSNEVQQDALAHARLKSVQGYLESTHYAGVVHEDVYLYRRQPPEGDTGRTVGLQFVPSQPVNCPQPRTPAVSFFIFSSQKKG